MDQIVKEEVMKVISSSRKQLFDEPLDENLIYAMKYGCFGIEFRKFSNTHAMIIKDWDGEIPSGTVYSIDELIAFRVQCKLWHRISYEEILELVRGS